MRQIVILVGIVLFTLSSCSKEEIKADSTFELSNSLNGFEYEISITEKNTNPNNIKN